MHRKIKVAFLQHGLGYGGATKSLILLQKSISNFCNVYTYTLPYPYKNHAIVNDFKNSKIMKIVNIPTIHSHPVSSTAAEDVKIRSMHYPKKFINELYKNNIDILHINSTLFSHILQPLKENTNVKIVVHLREAMPNGKSFTDEFIIDNILRYADGIIAISDNEVKFYPDSPKIEILPNPHEFTYTDKLLINEEKKEIIIGMCANFSEDKGHLDFLEMASIVEKKCKMKNLKFKIIGYPKNSLKEIIKKAIKRGFKQKFDERLRKLKINNIEIIKYTFDIYEEISSWDIYVRPDYTGQPWGRDIIEAMAMKKAIVATGTSEFFIENGKTGFLVPPRNPQVMAEKVIELIENEEMRKEFGERGYKKIKEMCDIDEYGKKIVEIYEELISE